MDRIDKLKADQRYERDTNRLKYFGIITSVTFLDDYLLSLNSLIFDLKEDKDYNTYMSNLNT